MPKAIQIRDVPDDVHAALRAKAAVAGKSLSDFLLGEISSLSRRKTVAEVIAQAETRKLNVPPDVIVETIRDLRGPLPKPKRR